MLNTPGQDDEDDELHLDFGGLDADDEEDDCRPLDDEREQTGFELLDWTAPMLDTLDDELHARGLAHEWVSDGFEVVVHEEDEPTVDVLIAELVAPFVGDDGLEVASREPDEGDRDTAEGAVALGADAGTGEPGDADGEAEDETPVDVVDALYQALSRMRRKPEGDARAAFLDAAEGLGEDPPFGVDPLQWRTVVRDVDGLLDALVGGSSTRVVTDRVEALRGRLRPLI